MVKTILEVPVDTSQFDDFLKLFGNYKEAVEKLPGAWGDVGEATANSGSAFASMTAALLAQQRLLHEQTEAKKAAAKATKDAASLESKAIRDRAAANKKAVDDTKKIAGNIKGATLDLLKWVGIGSLGGLAGGALGFWGLDRFAAGIGNEYRTSTGLNVSTGQHRALKTDYSRYFDVDPALSGVASAQNDPSLAWIWSGLGIQGAQNKDAAELLMEAAEAVSKQAKGVNKQNLAPWAQARGWDKIFSMEGIRNLAAATPAQMAAQRGQFGRDAKSFDVPIWVSNAFQAFTAKLTGAGQAIETEFARKVIEINKNGALDRLIIAFEHVVTSAIDRIDFDKIAKGLDKFADFIGSPQFQADVDAFMADFGALANWVGGLLTKWGLIPGPVAAVGSGGADSTPYIDWDERASGAKKFGKFAVAQERAAGGFFMKQGWDKNAAAGLVANLEDESGMNPFARGDKNKRGQFTAYGIGQWHADRQADYLQHFGHTMQSVSDIQKALAEQLLFVQYELTRGKDHGAREAAQFLRQGLSADQAGQAVSAYYERPGGGRAEAHKRGQGAQVVVKVFNQTGAQVAVTGSQLAQ